MLAAVQIGVTLAGFFSAAYGAPTIGARLMQILTRRPVDGWRLRMWTKVPEVTVFS